ncbi:unnamed protein product [Mytilus coruscus]|uniref:G-protein coupled receptors family 2 profile 1 domain-containing protein n=1 Tax=Mytilus coruscus TaxID=42192 RepID=A0A6J8B1V3_MYTCO|nr:unnamed protein product [Mytilus coruscus]
MSITSKPTTVGPTVAESTTIQKTTVQPTTVQPTTVQPTTVQPTTVQPTTVQPTTVQPTTVQQTTIKTTTTSIPTTAVVAVVSTSTNNACTNDEDSNFSCALYEMMYDLCKATTGTLYSIAHKRCQAFCGICSASLPTQPTCIDHDPRCSQFQINICSSSVSQNFVISTCPKSCNKCTEYLAATTPTTITCNTCGDISNSIPCYSRDVYKNSSTKICPSGYNYCMTDVLYDGNGNSDVYKRCVTKQTCDTKWLKESADQDYCMRYGVVNNANAFECHFCCTGDQCNSVKILKMKLMWLLKRFKYCFIFGIFILSYSGSLGIRQVIFRKTIPGETLWNMETVDAWKVVTRTINTKGCLNICVAIDNCVGAVTRTLDDGRGYCMPLRFQKKSGNSYTPLSSSFAYSVFDRTW